MQPLQQRTLLLQHLPFTWIGRVAIGCQLFAWLSKDIVIDWNAVFICAVVTLKLFCLCLI